MSMQTLHIQTDRLCLDNITAEDAEFIVRLRSNPNVYKFFINPKEITISEHLDWYNNSYKYDNSRIDLIARRTDNKARIGVFGLKHLDNNIVEISYILDPVEKGKGYSKEAVSGMIKWIQESKLDCSSIIATIHHANIASLNFIMNLGFAFLEENSPFVIYVKSLT